MRKHSVSFIIGIVLVAFAFALASASLAFMPYDPEEMDIYNRLQVPSPAHLLGTDHFGRDILSRIMSGSLVALSGALVSVMIGALSGIVLGTISALSPEWIGSVLQRVIDALMAFPTILIALVLVAIAGKGLLPSVAAIALAMVPVFSRLVYTMMLETKEKLYVKAAVSYGSGWLRIVAFHMIPSMASRLITQFTSSIGSAILLESSLSFLGLGIQPPSSSLGMMLSEARSYVLTYPYQAIPSGVVLLIIVLGFNLLGDGISEVFARRRRMRHG